LTVKKVQPDNSDVLPALEEGRRGRGRPRRIKESGVIKTTVEAESFAPSTTGATDETDNLEWVQCEHCQKWRKLPAHVSADDLPETWYCSMNTWNVASSSCDAPEDKADGLQDVGFHAGANSGKLSYRNLIFGNNGRKPNRPISERTRAAESLFLAPNDDEDAPPVVMYASSSAFVVRKKGNPALVAADDTGSLSILELMSHSNLWAELRAAPQPLDPFTSTDSPNELISYTYDTLPSNVKFAIKELLIHTIGERKLTSDEIVSEAKRRKADDSSIWSTTRSYCDLNVIVTTLFELAKEGAIECVRTTDFQDWNPCYRLSKRQREKTAVVAASEETKGASSLMMATPKAPMLMKISKPWKHAARD
jgi:hypothetical protein